MTSTINFNSLVQQIEWIRKLWYIYTMKYYSAIKKNTFESVLMRWMKLEPIIQSEISQKEKHNTVSVQFSLVAQSCPTLCDPMNCLTPGLPVHHQLPEFTQTHIHRVSLYISSRWCHPAISSSAVPFSSYPQSLPASEFFPVSQLFTWGGQNIGVSALASVLPMNTQDWSPLEWTGWISLKSEGLSRVFSNTTVQKHQFFGSQPSSQSNSRIHTWPQEKP